MGRISRILGASTTATLDVAVEESLEQVGRSLGADVAFAILVDEHECIADDWRWVGDGRAAVPPAPGSPLRDTFGSMAEILRLGHSVAVEDLDAVELAPSERALATANGLRSIVVAPVRIGSTLLGLTGLQVFGRPHDWSKVVVDQLEMLAGLLVQAVQRTRERGALAAADARARRIAEYIPDGLVLLDPGGTINWVSPSFARATGVPSSDIVGRPFSDLLHPDDLAVVAAAVQDDAKGGSGVQVRLQSPDGWRWTDASWQLVHDADPAVPDEIVVSLRDVHAQRLRTEQLAHESRREALTGALNRTGLDEALATLGQRDQAVLIGFVDIDDFKAVNDTEGHEAGDAVLRAVAGALRGAVRSSDHVARVGGDEFCVVVAADGQAAQGTALAGRLLTTVRGALAELDSAPTVSIGIAGPAPATDASELRRAADAAMYRAKRAGGNRAELDPRP
jgi:diguanylate cyclase (GGDEF)-like protein/PAS domain S-box-containing protein